MKNKRRKLKRQSGEANCFLFFMIEIEKEREKKGEGKGSILNFKRMEKDRKEGLSTFRVREKTLVRRRGQASILNFKLFKRREGLPIFYNRERKENGVV